MKLTRNELERTKDRLKLIARSPDKDEDLKAIATALLVVLSR